MSEYSSRWRDTFGRVDPTRTEADLAFLVGTLPLPEFARLLDVPCGTGRHLRPLRALGYDVTGVDVDPVAAGAAGHHALVGDMRELDGLPGDFDGVLNMWQSFGYFDEPTNERVLGSFARRLRPGGRLVLDLHNRAFFEPRSPSERALGGGVVERATFEAGRRRCELRYPDGELEVFEFQLYEPGELVELGAPHGLEPVLVEASADEPLLRLVLERTAPPQTAA
ncbi:MAG TPA: class I SAM-dependent methyltransferase [Gaiellaceae bacterium]|nr:class I SAM-dependent methyltransferase [Gaiellaceae bacterium]